MFAFVSTHLKVLVPGYRRRLYRRHAALVDLINGSMPDWSFGRDNGVPWIESRKDRIRLHGFVAEPSNAELYDILQPVLPRQLRRDDFRLAKDYITRWIWPHMRPDLGPEGYAVEQLHGLHGQHKDNISSIENPSARERLTRAFRPGAEDVVIDCGAFLGFGSIHMARDASKGRIFALEASSECHRLLQRNVEINRIANVIPLHRGVWNVAGEITLEKTYAQGNSLVAEVQRGVTHETVKTVSIDGVVKEHGLTRVDMVSLTLNGAEVEALQGAQDTLKNMRPRIRAAGWYMRDGRKIANIIRPELERHDYDVFIGPRNNVMALPRERA